MSTEADNDELNPLKSFVRGLSQLREARGMSMKALGHAVGYSLSYVSKVESCTVKPSLRYVEGCDVAFGTGVKLQRDYERLLGVSPRWLKPYLDLEREALEVRDYATTFISGIAQTPEYAEATFRASHPHDPPELIAARVEERIRRRSVLERPSPPLLWLVIHEAALRMVVGSVDVMIRQLEYLVELAEHPHVVLQIYQFKDAVPATGLPFTLLTMDEGATCLYAEAAGRGVLSDSADGVRYWRSILDRLCAEAKPPSRTVQLLTEIIEEYRA